MSDHKKTQFMYFTKEDMDKGLSLHRLPTDTPSQLADSFRAGAQWAVGKYLDALIPSHQPAIDKNQIA